MAPTKSMQPLPLDAVRFEDAFWAPRIATNRLTTLPHEYRQCRDTGRIDAFKLDWRPGRPHQPHIFWDSDVAKWVEAAAYSLVTHPDKRLAQRLEEVVELIASAQQPDGYLNTYFTVVEPDRRWDNLAVGHELYCAGHLMEAAVAHHQATGSRRLLDTMCRYADLIAARFGTGKGQIPGYPGHEEIELALVKLYRATANRKCLDLAAYFVNQRGQQPHYFDIEARRRGDSNDSRAVYHDCQHTHFQAHAPVREQRDAMGHAVRAMYLYCGMADVAAESGDATLLAACRRLFDSVAQRRMYITGGIGARRVGEEFGADYELPNEKAYAETCAAIGLVFFAQRMANITADGRYADVMERALYNGVLSGVGLDGKHFFYANPLAVYPDSPLASDGHAIQSSRVPWFGCACCPPNIARLLASLGYYAYAQAGRSVYVHLYVAGSARWRFGRQEVTLHTTTKYPYQGRVDIRIEAEQPVDFTLALRIPRWCPHHKLTANGQVVRAAVAKGYARLKRRFAPGDRLRLELDMPVVRVEAHPLAAENIGRVALQRGPLVYCVEQCDHDVDIRMLRLPDGARISARFDPRLAGGATILTARGRAVETSDWKDDLYRPASSKLKPAVIIAVPYCLWNNRGPGAMQVWLPRC